MSKETIGTFCNKCRQTVCICGKAEEENDKAKEYFINVELKNRRIFALEMLDEFKVKLQQHLVYESGLPPNITYQVFESIRITLEQFKTPTPKA